jgi:hypothetical protein
MEFKKGDLLLSENKGDDGIIKKILSKFNDIKKRAKSEMEETKALIRILTHAVKSYSKNREFEQLIPSCAPISTKVPFSFLLKKLSKNSSCPNCE